MATAKKTTDKKKPAPEAGITFRARVIVYPRPEILDPQGKAIAQALGRLGFAGVQDVRAGKSFAIAVDAASRDEAEKALAAMAEGLLANPIVEDFTVELLDEA